MTLLALLLAIDAALHALLVYRFGIKENMSFFVYVFIDAALALAVFLNLPYVLWAALILSVIGFVGLTVRFNLGRRFGSDHLCDLPVVRSIANAYSPASGYFLMDRAKPILHVAYGTERLMKVCSLG